MLHGSVIQNSPYEIFMGKSDFKVLCKVTLTAAESKLFAQRIKQDYRVQMIMDNLPAVRARLARRARRSRRRAARRDRRDRRVRRDRRDRRERAPEARARRARFRRRRA